MIKIVSQHIDTLKLHFYSTNEVSPSSLSRYNLLIEKLISLKKQAQQKSNDLESIDDIKHKIEHQYMNIMSKSIKGFSVVIYNRDFSLAMKKITNTINPSPIMKLELRAEFLARYGYVKCLKMVNRFISINILDSYKIKVSEIHLATDIQGYNFAILDYYKVRSRARNAQLHSDDEVIHHNYFGTLTNFTGFVYGSGNYMLRVYNKTKEINKFQEKAFAKELLWSRSLDYQEDKTVWRIEFQLRREKLKGMITDDGDILDGYESILNNIPSIWSKCVNDFKLKDLEDEVIFDMLKGYKTLKNGKTKYLTKHSIYQTFKRAPHHEVWYAIEKFNKYNPTPIYTAFEVPKNGSIYYVQNSIKSLLSTMGRYYGAINKDTMKRAFKEANQENKRRKSISIIDDAVNKQIDYMERIEFTRLSGVVDVPDYKDLLNDLIDTVDASATCVYEDDISQNTRDRLVEIVNTYLQNDLSFESEGF